MKIMIVCGAGASSTFVALRVRRSAARRGLELTVQAGSESALHDVSSDIDVFLVGPHLEPRFDVLRAEAEAAGAVLVLLPPSIFAARDGELALDLALEAMTARS